MISIKDPLLRAIVQAGLSLSVRRFFGLSAGAPVVVAIVALVAGIPPVVAACFALIAGLGLPRIILTILDVCLRDGSRKIAHVTEVVGMQGDAVTLQELLVFDIQGEDAQGRLLGRHLSTGLRPKFWDYAKYFGLGRGRVESLEAAR